jgi:hypothetical protein
MRRLLTCDQFLRACCFVYDDSDELNIMVIMAPTVQLTSVVCPQDERVKCSIQKKSVTEKCSV